MGLHRWEMPIERGQGSMLRGTFKGGSDWDSGIGVYIVSLTPNHSMKKNDLLQIRKYEINGADYGQSYAISVQAHDNQAL